MKIVLLIAGLKERYYYDPFLSACLEKRLTVYVFDPSLFPQKSSISLSFDPMGSVCGFIDVFDLRNTEPLLVRLQISDIDIAWYLRENPSQQMLDDDNIVSKFTRNESRATFLSFCSMIQCSWVNRKSTIDYLTSNKLYQQWVNSNKGT